jgi:hypothetical protein
MFSKGSFFILLRAAAFYKKMAIVENLNEKKNDNKFRNPIIFFTKKL